MERMSPAEGVNEDACRLDPSLSDANVTYFLPSDGSESYDEESARYFDFDTGSWLYKEDNLRINKRLIILQEVLNRMIAKKNLKGQGFGKENKVRSRPMRRSCLPSHVKISTLFFINLNVFRILNKPLKAKQIHRDSSIKSVREVDYLTIAKAFISMEPQL